VVFVAVWTFDTLTNAKAGIAKHGTALNAGAHKFPASLGASSEFMAPEVCHTASSILRIHS